MLTDVPNEPDRRAGMFVTFANRLLAMLQRGTGVGMKSDGIFTPEAMGLKISPRSSQTLLREVPEIRVSGFRLTPGRARTIPPPT
jgi:hypothetical protein